MLNRLRRGVGGAKAFTLNNANVWFRFFSHRVHVIADHDNDTFKYGLATGQQMAQHRPSGQPVQGLRQRRFHPGTEAGGQDDCGCLHALALLR
jgi:hypothetical protein